MKSREELESIATQIVDSALAMHRALGPGLLESAYQACLVFEVRRRGFHVDCEVKLPVVYGGLHIDAGYRVDVFVEGEIIIENKSVQTLQPIHEAQLLTYLKLSGGRLGFLINCNVVLIKDGIKRLVN